MKVKGKLIIFILLVTFLSITFAQADPPEWAGPPFIPEGWEDNPGLEVAATHSYFVDSLIEETPDYFELTENSYEDYYCEKNGFSYDCVYQTQVDEDYPCEITDEGDIFCEGVADSRIESYSDRISKGHAQLLSNYGMAVVDFRNLSINEYNQSIAEVAYMDTELDQTLHMDMKHDGFVQVGYSTNTFFYTDLSYSSTINVSVDRTIELSNVEYNCTSDPTIIACWHFREDARDSVNSTHDLEVFNANHTHEGYDFDADRDYLQLTTTNNGRFVKETNDSFTAMAWIEWTGGTFAGEIIGFDGQTVNRNWQFSIQNNGRLTIAISDGVSQHAYTTPYPFDVATNDPTFVAVTYNKSNDQIEVYINNKTLRENSTVKLYNRQYPFNIGTIDDGVSGNTFNGTIFEAIVFNRSLLYSEVVAIFQEGLFHTGEDDDANFISSVLVANQSVNWTYYNMSVISNNETNISIRFRSGDAQKPSATDDGLIFYTSFDNVTYPILPNAEDTQFLTHFTDDATEIIGDYTPTIYDAQHSYNAYLFNGINESINYYNTQVNFSNFTISVWFRKEAGFSPNYARVIDISGEGKSLLRTSVYSTSNIQTQLMNSVGTSFYTFHTGQVTKQDWYHLVISYNSTANLMSAYLDGGLTSNTLKTVSTTGDFNLTNADINIGGYFSGLPRYWGGEIDEVTILNSTIDAAEVLALFEQGRQSIEETVLNGRIPTQSNVAPGYFYGNTSAFFGFNRTGPYNDNQEVIVFNNATYKEQLNFTDTNFTITAMIKPIKNGYNNRNMDIFSYGRDVNASFGNTGGYRLYLVQRAVDEDYKLYFGYFNETLDSLRQAVCNNPLIIADDWTQVTATFQYSKETDRSNMTLYINGDRCRNKLDWGAISPIIHTGEPTIMPCIGALGHLCNASVKYNEFVGNIDEVAIYDRVLQEDELISFGGWTAIVPNENDVIITQNNPMLQFQAYLYGTTNSTPILHSVDVSYGIPTNQTASIPTILVKKGTPTTFNLAPYFNLNEGGAVKCEGQPGYSVASYSECLATYTAGEFVNITFDTYTLKVDNGWGAINATVLLQYTNSSAEHYYGVTNGSLGAMVNMAKYLPMAATVASILLVLIFLSGFFAVNHKKRFKVGKEMIVALMFVAILTSGGTWIIVHFFL